MLNQKEEIVPVEVNKFVDDTPQLLGYIDFTSSLKVETIFKKINSLLNEPEHILEDVEIILEGRGPQFNITPYKEKTLKEIGISTNIGSEFKLRVIMPKDKMSLCAQEVIEEDLWLGASASPTTTESINRNTNNEYFHNEILPSLTSDDEYGLSTQGHNTSIDIINYVGLVNQAMTCYLNSLLQALYMTPEFRNALYNWEFDGQNESRSIPFQLQKLFLNLQTSSKPAVETTNLTTSFGWQGSDAWQQHDIQELCRVMFDALEQKFKNTKQANLINDLYEGKMLDYVRCLECSTEKSREDTFLDIPLPVRPYGSQVAYNSVEEALRAFVQPEILDGNNQYNCEKCNKKCDAHKGLKFIKFPYLLTLHLKRFDFDYNTLHRIKLNDKVVFSEILNLNSFIQSNTSESEEQLEEKEMTKYDIDCCTTDSGSALEDEGCQSTDASSAINGQDVNCSESDEGIDVSSGNNHKVEPKGPYTYDLFSIMIHSGSATGGHYYAYIKDFEKQQWYCFNDQSVTKITEDDIRKTYGGASHRGYYSGAYSSSTNAYMLMYRQIDKERNSKAMSVEEFPPHIRTLLKQMREKEEQDRKIKEKENELVKINVFCFHPIERKLLDAKVPVFIDYTLEETVSCAAYLKFKLEGIVAKEDCRLVKFNKLRNCIDYSFASDKIKFCDISSDFSISLSDWFLEIRPPNTPWEVYKAGGVNVRVYPINLQLEELEEPFMIRVNARETVGELKQRFSLLLNRPSNTMQIIEEKYIDPIYYERDDQIVNDESNSFESKLLYVANFVENDPDKSSGFSKLKRVIEKFRHVISIRVFLPDVDAGILEMLSIPLFDPNQNLERLDMSLDDRNSPNLSDSPQQASTVICCDGFGDQSNSEDSSLSDSDRTLVGDAPGDGMGISSNSSNSPGDQHMVSPSDPTEDSYNYEVLGNPAEDMYWDDNETEEEQRISSYYFKVLNIVSEQATEFCPYSRYSKIFVDKRITLDRLKRHLEPYVKVPAEYFKIYRQYQTSSNPPEDGNEWLNLNDTLKCMKDGDCLNIKLGRVLRKDEYNVKVYILRPNSQEPISFLFEHIIAKGQTVSQVLKDIILQAKKRRLLDLSFQKCRLREKSWKKAKRIYLENEIFGEDILFTSSVLEIFLQELEDGERVNCINQTALFIRRWRPSILQLEPIQEVIMNTSSLEELKVAMCQLSGIPLENCELTLVKTYIPGDMHKLEINDLDWKVTATCFDECPLYASNGSIFYYRDKREPLKELTPEERKELNLQENKRLGLTNSIKSYSPGKERGLKIYLDMSPCKKNDNYTD